MRYLTVKPDTQEKLLAVKDILTALKINFIEVEDTYNAGFISKIHEGEEDIKMGRTKNVALSNLWK